MSAESETREARLVQKRQLQIVIALSAGILLLEVAGGLLSGSLALNNGATLGGSGTGGTYSGTASVPSVTRRCP